ncbi:MAG TPA: rhodanese-like domain-containing protein [Alphaproteobacteria bacterium]|nr:rhodanese-like domain-containing protein [Alphaproteobacteria bacterium]
MSEQTQAYAGDVDASHAWQILERDAKAVLVDVRTKPEWRYVGAPDLRPLGKEAIYLEWQAYPDLALNPRFVSELEARGIDKDAPIFFLCRSGARSRAAAIALTQRGYRRCYNIADGFEGPKDAEGHRGRQAGWKASGLPWFQE